MMLGRLAREESGVALALAVFVMVIVGVMGAGLLVFVNTDLSAVVESNRGQKAFNLADAGVQAGRRYLLVDATAAKYDGANSDDSAWSCGAWDATNQRCTASGQTLNLDGGVSGDTMTVWIQYLQPATSPSHLTDPRYAPELAPAGGNYPVGKDYFKIIAEGRSGDARRRVEAIYNTVSLDLPRAYYTPGSITLAGGAAEIKNISLFAGGNINGKVNSVITGVDLAYGDWNKPPYNTTPRSAPTCTATAPDGTTTTGPCAGAAAALGNVDPAYKVPGRDYDRIASPAASPATFVATPSSPQPSNQITFPFNASATPNLEELRAAAQAQSNGIGGDNYYEATANTNIESAAPGKTVPVWPANSTVSTVVYVKFINYATLNWVLGGSCSSPPVRGTLVVENGGVDTQPGQTPLRGIIIVRGAGPGTEVYKDSGSSCMEAFVIASGDMTINGRVGAFTEERGNRPGFYNLRLWSWRELYS